MMLSFHAGGWSSGSTHTAKAAERRATAIVSARNFDPSQHIVRRFFHFWAHSRLSEALLAHSRDLSAICF